VKTEKVTGEKVELLSIEPPLQKDEIEEEIRQISEEIVSEDVISSAGHEVIRKRTVDLLIQYSESRFEIKHGILISGAVSKQFVGTGSRFLGYIYREYGGEFGIDFISDADALANWYIEKRGFSMGLNDVIDVARRRENKEAITKAIVEASLKAQFYGPAVSNPIDERRRQRNIIEALNIVQDIGTALLTSATSAFPSSSFRQMIDSGAKGKVLNVAQAGGTTGLFVPGGGLIQPSLEGRISAFFPKGSSSPAAIGYASSSLAEGLSVSEKVNEARSTREDLITMKLSTPTSGYMHRRFTTLMQKLVVNYRQGVSDGTNVGAKLIQPIYGECGFAATELYQIKHPDGDFLSPIDMDQLFRNLEAEAEEFPPVGYSLSSEWESYDSPYLRRAIEGGVKTDPRFVNIETGKLDYPLEL
jgi:DNA-directed RNA polymerase beta' subunit